MNGFYVACFFIIIINLPLFFFADIGLLRERERQRDKERGREEEKEAEEEEMEEGKDEGSKTVRKNKGGAEVAAFPPGDIARGSGLCPKTLSPS